MKILTNSTEEPLIEIVVDRQGLIVMISAAAAAITHANEWNFGDEYDVDITPYHHMYGSLKEQYERFFGPYDVETDEKQ
jgi:hypothetical protein